MKITRNDLIRDDLVEKKRELQKQVKEIDQQIDAFDYEDRLANAKKHHGKYFKQQDNNHVGNIDCLFVYGVDLENCSLMSLRVNYYNDNEFSWFEIAYYSNFYPDDEDISGKWIEISKDEFMQHYLEVQKRISISVKSNNLLIGKINQK